MGPVLALVPAPAPVPVCQMTLLLARPYTLGLKGDKRNWDVGVVGEVGRLALSCGASQSQVVRTRAITTSCRFAAWTEQRNAVECTELR